MNEIINQLTGAILLDSPFSYHKKNAIDWNAVFEEMKTQTIYALPYNWLLENQSVDSRLKDRWLNLAMSNVANYYNLLDVQKRLDELFTLHNIRYVILKGTAAGMYYPEPELRCYGDIDVLVGPEDFNRALANLKEAGYEFIGDDGRHAELSCDGIVIELHHLFADNNVDNAGKNLDQFLKMAIPNAVYRNSCEGFYSLPDLENGLVLLQHIKQHMQSGLGLRQIFDWMLYVKCVLSNEFWMDCFEDRAKEFRLRELAITVTRMCQMYFGLSDKITWCAEADVDLCHSIMDLISNSGNFGNKQENSSVNVMWVLTSKNLFQRLQRRGLFNWKATQKYPFLRPFAWLYQIGRYIVLGLRREAPIRSLLKNIKDSRNRKNLFKKLKH